MVWRTALGLQPNAHLKALEEKVDNAWARRINAVLGDKEKVKALEANVENVQFMDGYSY